MGDDGFQLMQVHPSSFGKSFRIDHSGMIVDQKVYDMRDNRSIETAEAISLAVVPPLPAVASTVARQSIWLGGQAPATASRRAHGIVLIGAIVHGVLAWWLTRLACRRRSLSGRHSMAWKLLSTITGVLTPLMVLCTHPRIPLEACEQCERLIRVDGDACPYCHADWRPPELLGIEILETPLPR